MPTIELSFTSSATVEYAGAEHHVEIDSAWATNLEIDPESDALRALLDDALERNETSVSDTLRLALEELQGNSMLFIVDMQTSIEEIETEDGEIR